MKACSSAFADQPVSFAAFSAVPPKPCSMITSGLGRDLSQAAGTWITNSRLPPEVMICNRECCGGNSSELAAFVRDQTTASSSSITSVASSFVRVVIADGTCRIVAWKFVVRSVAELLMALRTASTQLHQQFCCVFGAAGFHGLQQIL